MIDTGGINRERYPVKRVLVHRPEVELTAVTKDTLDYFNSCAVRDPDGFLREFDALADARVPGTWTHCGLGPWA